MSLQVVHQRQVGQPMSVGPISKAGQKSPKVTLKPGDETGFIGNVHKGPSGYRDVYVNDIGAAMLEGEGPYNFPAGTVVVKEQFNDKAAWESGEGGAVTVSVKAESTDAVAKENWIWATSYNAKAGASAFCSGCHSIAAKDDFVFTHGAFLASQ